MGNAGVTGRNAIGDRLDAPRKSLDAKLLGVGFVA